MVTDQGGKNEEVEAGVIVFPIFIVSYFIFGGIKYCTLSAAQDAFAGVFEFLSPFLSLFS